MVQSRLLRSLAVAACAMAGGCASVTPTYQGALNEQAIIDLLPPAADDKPPPAPAATPAVAAAPSAPAPPASDAVRKESVAEASHGIESVRVLTGPPALPETPSPSPLGASDTPPASETVLIDAMVGQINGRPLYASEFFAPMDARLRADARQMAPEPWLRSVKEQIHRALLERVRDELLLAEFEASLTPEQKVGVLAFVQNLRSQFISQNRGSEMLAREQAGQQGATLEEKVRQDRDKALIAEQLRQAVVARMYVSWREVQQEYERNIDKYSPPGRVTLRMIWVPKSDQARIDRVSAALAAGEPFADIARRESDFRCDDGGLHEAALDAPTLAQAHIFGPPELNTKATALEEGETVGPFTFQDKMVWITLEAVLRQERSLFDVQLEVTNDLWNRRFFEENRKYIGQLVERGSLTDIQEMENRLLEIAAHRYLIAGRQ